MGGQSQLNSCDFREERRFVEKEGKNSAGGREGGGLDGVTWLAVVTHWT